MSVFVLLLKNFRKEEQSLFLFCEKRGTAVLVCVCVNLDFKRVNVEYACGTLNR